MFNTLAHCLGFTSNGLSPIGSENVNFITKEADDHWTLVDVDNNDDGNQVVCPTTVSTHKMELSWLVTPPPCFNAEVHDHLTPLNHKENLMIEHPSMFVKPMEKLESEVKVQTDIALEQPRVSVTTRRSQRKVRVASYNMTQQHRRNVHYKRSNDVSRRNNKTFQKMRQIVHQPRKHC